MQDLSTAGNETKQIVRHVRRRDPPTFQVNFTQTLPKEMMLKISD